MFGFKSTLTSLLVTASLFNTGAVAQYLSNPYVKYCDLPDMGGPCVTISEAEIGRCYSIPSNMNDKLSSYEVKNGECEFYRHGGCVERLWTARDRSHMSVTTSGHNNEVSSIKCTKACCGKDYFTYCYNICIPSCRRGSVTDQLCIANCSKDCCPGGVTC
ncbi:hypothetical protein QC762_0015210 [Podospora pseudocomata]|uniref:Uncharacterized protein n=3 Tax=Podospora TaxID=5144 RepID=A0ABR0I0M4_9PEZI|nr:hypothetical protein QC762_0015210 [Podospora pseudocomata]KAK4673893.1 hypothetical protein QC763_0018710 [Podospora pseudopauciseta]KAK4682388.1 hypothetical protein QC764_0018650 [Podospora pseudoanserina]